MFFQKVNIHFQRNCRLMICVLMFCRLSYHILEFLSYAVSLKLLSMFSLLVQFVILPTLTSFLFLFFRLKNCFDLNNFGLLFIGLPT